MLKIENDIGRIKHEVLYEVAKYAFAGEPEGGLEQMPYEMIPGPKPQFRCCIYKEREIIRERIRLAQGKSPVAGKDNKNIVQVITSACEGCPITRFVVTDNCQKCMSKKCQGACNFGAISMSRDRAYIDPSKCKECGKCSQACPYNAIADLMRPCKRSCPVDAISMDENGIVVIDEERCINCGACIKDCPFGAISDRSFIVDVIRMLRAGIPVYAMVAPAIEGQFEDASVADIAEAIRKLGFTDMYEVSLGADLTAAGEAKEWAEAYAEGKKMTTSCCPAFVNMIKKHFPQLLPNMSTTASPMVAVARYIKAVHPDAMTVFIGPCVAKKGEVLDTITQHAADYALTFDELFAMLRAKDIKVEASGLEQQQGSIYGRRFSQSGGVTKAVLQSLKETGENTNIQVKVCNGAAECKKALMLLRAGKLPEDFIEGMACEGGCVNGPGAIAYGPAVMKARETSLAQGDKRGVYENLQQFEVGSQDNMTLEKLTHPKHPRKFEQ